MNIQEIFLQLTNHMLEGMMVHEQLANYFAFLVLQGYQCCHEYHHLDETLNYRRLQQYYIEHYNLLLPEPQPTIIQTIPPVWYNIDRQQITIQDKQEGIKKGMLAWQNWEYETKKLYEQSYSNLLSIAEVASAEQIKELIIDVDNELVEVEQMYLSILAIDIDLTVIIPEQKELFKTYSKKIKKIMEN